MEEIKNNVREANPFESPEIAKQWMKSVEGEKGLIRDREIYPLLRDWASAIGKGVVVEIGSGQGICSQQLGDFNGNYIGIEPSEVLTNRGKELYGKNKHLSFVVGSAYELPIHDNSADGVFSVNVWFHLAKLTEASKELSRILKTNRKFNIITTNPDYYGVWKEFFEDYRIEGKLLTGKVNVPINPMSRNDFYMHSMSEMTEELTNCGLEITSITALGIMSKHPDKPIFVSIQGLKT